MAQRHHKTDKVWHERFWPLLENKKLGKNKRYVNGAPGEGSDAIVKALGIVALLAAIGLIVAETYPSLFTESWVWRLVLFLTVMSPLLLVMGLKSLKAGTLKKRKKAIQAQLDRR